MKNPSPVSRRRSTRNSEKNAVKNKTLRVPISKLVKDTIGKQKKDES